MLNSSGVAVINILRLAQKMCPRVSAHPIYKQIHLSSSRSDTPLNYGLVSSSMSTNELMTSIANLSPKTANSSHVGLLHQLTSLLLKSPKVAFQAWEMMGVVSNLVELQDCGLIDVEDQARLSLSLLGYAPPYSGKGLRILSIDGGGTR